MTLGRFIQALGQSFEAYHGSGASKPITNFRPGTFFAKDQDLADSYSTNMGDGLTEHVSLDPKNPLRIYHKNFLQVAEEAGYGEQVLENIRRHDDGYGVGNTLGGEFDLLVKWAQSRGYDLLEFQDPDFTNSYYGETYLVVDPSIITHIKTGRAS